MPRWKHTKSAVRLQERFTIFSSAPGEWVKKLEPVIAIKVVAEAEVEKQPAPAKKLVQLASPREGIVLAIGSEIKQGEQVPTDRLVSIYVGRRGP